MSETTADPGSFVKRHLDVTLTLGGSTFDGVNDTVTLSGLRMSAAIVKQGGISQGALDLRIYGMTQSLMNRCTLISGQPENVAVNNTVTLKARSGASGAAVAYQGTINNAWPDYSGAPDVSFNITAFGALAAAVTPVAPSSYKGTADVATIMESLAKTMGFAFENNGVNVKLSNPYFPGTAYQQFESCARAAGISATVDDHKLAIWPRGGHRMGDVPLLTPQTGLVGYPVKNAIGVTCRCLYNPVVTLGATIKIQSSITPACGTWKVFGVNHNLESETPGGQWFSELACVPLGFL